MVRQPPSPPSFHSTTEMQSSPHTRRQYTSNTQDPQSQYNDLFRDLHALHADEFAYLSQSITDFDHRCHDSWMFRTLGFLKHYLLFLLTTWAKALWASIFLPFTLMDRITIIVTSLVSSAVISILLPWCLLCSIPITGLIFDYFSCKFLNGLSLVNAMYPSIFNELTDVHISAAREYLSRPIEASEDFSSKRIFNLDASKLLLQCAALMYERTSHSTHRAALACSSKHNRPVRQEPESYTSNACSLPGRHLLHLFGRERYDSVLEALHGELNREEETIRSIANEKLHLHYSTISEMNSPGGPMCGLFFDPDNSFIILAFKGTTPTDFSEWSTDFTFQLQEAGKWIRGFGKVHSGFLRKVFPNRIPVGSRMPYTTIIQSIKSVAKRLRQENPRRQINVWVTGHSLGCALASLAYSRMITEKQELGSDVIIRDAYLFAAPILCDVQSACAFDGRMNKFSDFPRTMWRVTNGGDAVATCLPDAGDNLDWTLSPCNVFSFSHLGCEIKLRPAPKRCLARGSHITPGSRIIIESAVHLDVLADEGKLARNGNSDSDSDTPFGLKTIKELERKIVEPDLGTQLLSLQKLPLIGRLLAHGTGFYWASLQKTTEGTCEWIYN